MVTIPGKNVGWKMFFHVDVKYDMMLQWWSNYTTFVRLSCYSACTDIPAVCMCVLRSIMFVSSDFHSWVVASTNTISCVDLPYTTLFLSINHHYCTNAATYLHSNVIINKNIHYNTQSWLPFINSGVKKHRLVCWPSSGRLLVGLLSRSMYQQSPDI